MAVFKNMVITYAGMALFAKAQAGQEIHFTKMQVGSGQVGTRNPSALTSLVEPKLDVPIASITPNPELKNATIIGNITNKGLKEATYICEMGIWAKDPNDGEILYGYANCGTYGDYYAPESEGAYSWQYQINAAIGNAANITASISELIWDHGVMNSNTNLIYLKGSTQKEINKSVDEAIDNLKEEMKDTKLKTFETDVLLTNLKDCNGGFVSLELYGNTEVNLSKFATVSYDDSNKVFRANCYSQNISNRTITIVNPTNRPICVETFKNGSYDPTGDIWVDSNSLKTILTSNVVFNVYGSLKEGWTDTNKNDLLKVMLLDGEVKTPPNYFEGMQSVGEKQPDGTYKIEISSSNKNLIKNSSDFSNLYGWYPYESTAISVDNDVKYNGFSTLKAVGNDGFYYEVIVLKPNTFYTYSCLAKSTIANIAGYEGTPLHIQIWTDKIGATDIHQEVYTGKFDTTISKDYWKKCYRVFKTPDGRGDCYFRLYQYHIGNNQVNYTNFQLEEGDKATEYESYKEDKTEILLKEPLREWDSIDNSGVINRGSGQIVLNGKEVWQLAAEGDNVNGTSVYLNASMILGEEYQYKPKCDKLRVINSWNTKDLDFMWINYMGGLVINLSNSKTGIISSDTSIVKIEKIQNYLSSNNITANIKLKAPIKENLNKSLLPRGFENGYLQINSGAIQPHAVGSYSTNTGERMGAMENAIEGVKNQAGILEYAVTAIAGNVINNKRDIAALQDKNTQQDNAIVQSKTDAINSSNSYTNSQISNLNNIIANLTNDLNNAKSTIAAMQNSIWLRKKV